MLIDFPTIVLNRAKIQKKSFIIYKLITFSHLFFKKMLFIHHNKYIETYACPAKIQNDRQ